MFFFFYSFFHPFSSFLPWHILVFCNVPASYLKSHHKIVNNLSTVVVFFSYLFAASWCHHSVCFLIPSFFLICPCAIVWMQFQMSCFKRHAKMYAVASVVHRFFPLDKNGVRFCCANAYTSRSHRWASNRMASRAVFTIGICQY